MAVFGYFKKILNKKLRFLARDLLHFKIKRNILGNFGRKRMSKKQRRDPSVVRGSNP